MVSGQNHVAAPTCRGGYYPPEIQYVNVTKRREKALFIKLLDKNLANMIAAGEVVERPASAVKELIENSIDAGASLVTVEISGGGLQYIKVSDNGCGIHPEDVENAFMRHATSKISKPEDLDGIYTLGFRGEALASIAAVAEVSLYTRTVEFETGMTCSANYGVIEDVTETPGFVGTEIRVKNLFYNTPARLKFLKKDVTEAGYVEEVVKKTALAHPEVSFRFINGGKEKIFTPGDGNLLNAIFAVYGKDTAEQVLNVETESDSVKIEGFVGNPVYTRKTRTMQLFYVNRRPVVSRLAANALEEAFKGLIPINTHPICFLNISVPAEVVDVNVHPSKLEVKFSDEQRIYRAVYHAVKNALNVKIMPKIEEKPKPMPEENKPKSVFEFKTSDAALIAAANFSEKIDSATLYDMVPQAMPSYNAMAGKDTKKPIRTFNDPGAVYSHNAEKKEPEQKEPEICQKNIIKNEDYVQIGVELEEELGYNIIGQIFNTYIIVERGDEMIMIDQHAAHEHITYARLIESYKNRSIVSQTMLAPEVVPLSALEKALWSENEDFFKDIGFEIENFGGNDIIVRSIPENTDIADIGAVIAEILESLKNNRLDAATSAAENALHTVACRSSIKAGKKLDAKEAKNLVKTLFSIEKTITCPHGRPAWFAMDKKFIEKQFKRIM